MKKKNKCSKSSQEILVSFSKGLNQEWVRGSFLLFIASRQSFLVKSNLISNFRFHVDFNRIDFKFVSESFSELDLQNIKNFFSYSKEDFIGLNLTESFQRFNNIIKYPTQNINILLTILSSNFLKLGSREVFGSRDDHLRLSPTLMVKFLDFVFSKEFVKIQVKGSSKFKKNMKTFFSLEDFLSPSKVDDFIGLFFEDLSPEIEDLDLTEREFRLPFHQPQINNFLSNSHFALEKGKYICYYWLQRFNNLGPFLMESYPTRNVFINFSKFPKFNLYYSLASEDYVSEISNLFSEGTDLKTKISIVIKES